MNMNYDEMSDWEVNVMVHYEFNNIPKEHATIIVKDYCKNPSDAWPIIVDNKIKLSPSHSINKNKDTWTASDGWIPPDSYHLDKNPLRAAMICFLKMKDKE